MSGNVGLPEALERAASALEADADAIRPANGDPHQLLESLDPQAAVRVLGWLLANEPDSGVELATAWAEQHEEGIAPLAALRGAPLAKGARKALRRALHQLRTRGVELPDAPRQRTVAKLPPVDDEINEALVTPLDPTGARLVYLAVSHPSGGARLFMVALDDERGVLEFELYNAPRRDARRFLRDFQRRERFAGVPAPHGAVRALIARTTAAHPSSRPLPKGFTEWRSRLTDAPEGTPTPGDLVRDALMLADADRDTAIERAVKLVTEGELGPWIPRVEVLEATAGKLRALGDSALIVSGATRRDQLGTLLDEALGETYAEPSGQRASRRFDESAFVFWKWAREADARACLAAADLFASCEPRENAVARAALERLMAPVLESLSKEEDEAGEEREQEPSLLVEP